MTEGESFTPATPTNQVSLALQKQVNAIVEDREVGELAVLIKAVSACSTAIMAVFSLPPE
jgi:hypothetical protein